MWASEHVSFHVHLMFQCSLSLSVFCSPFHWFICSQTLFCMSVCLWIHFIFKLDQGSQYRNEWTRSIWSAGRLAKLAILYYYLVLQATIKRRYIHILMPIHYVHKKTIKLCFRVFSRTPDDEFSVGFSDLQRQHQRIYIFLYFFRSFLMFYFRKCIQ